MAAGPYRRRQRPPASRAGAPGMPGPARPASLSPQPLGVNRPGSRCARPGPPSPAAGTPSRHAKVTGLDRLCSSPRRRLVATRHTPRHSARAGYALPGTMVWSTAPIPLVVWSAVPLSATPFSAPCRCLVEPPRRALVECLGRPRGVPWPPSWSAWAALLGPSWPFSAPVEPPPPSSSPSWRPWQHPRLPLCAPPLAPPWRFSQWPRAGRLCGGDGRLDASDGDCSGGGGGAVRIGVGCWDGSLQVLPPSAPLRPHPPPLHPPPAPWLESPRRLHGLHGHPSHAAHAAWLGHQSLSRSGAMRAPRAFERPPFNKAPSAASSPAPCAPRAHASGRGGVMHCTPRRRACTVPVLRRRGCVLRRRAARLAAQEISIVAPCCAYCGALGLGAVRGV
jgi:hypothetical protein